MPENTARQARFSLPLALGWTVLITAALWLALSLVFALFGRRADDIVLLGSTQVAVYALVLGLFAVSVALPPREMLALEPASPVLCLASLLLGFALQVPATLLADEIEHFFPLPEAVLAERAARLTPHSPAHALAIVAVVAVLGPCMEEFFFRGALFGALRRGHGKVQTIAVVSLCFALGHLDLRLLFPLFVAALVIGAVRELSGSIWPGLAVHAAFNSATLAVVFVGKAPLGKPAPLPASLAVSGCALTIGLFVWVRALALSRVVAQNPPHRDLD